MVGKYFFDWWIKVTSLQMEKLRPLSEGQMKNIAKILSTRVQCNQRTILAIWNSSSGNKLPVA